MGLGGLLGTIMTGGRWAPDTGWVGTFTAPPGEFTRGNRIAEEKTNWRGQTRTVYREVTGTQRRYSRSNDEYYDRGTYRTVDSLHGCTCGHPGCPG